MSARFWGRLALALAALFLVLDVIRNLPGEPAPLGQGPAGFPWPTRGLGEITLGMEGRFQLDLEERVEGDTGAQERVPQMSLAGSDPRPDGDGMRLRQAVIRSFGEGEEQGVVRVRVDAPAAWIPMSVAADGTRELDRTQAWKFTKPVVTMPALGNRRSFVLETESAELDPLTNEIFCPGSFVLRSGGLRFEGTGLRLTPDDDLVRFGESDGRISWSLALDDGGVLQGATDGGGELRTLTETTSQLSMRAQEQCWITLPAESGLDGRLETLGLDLLLSSAEATDSAEEAKWTPRTLDGAGPTFWSGVDQILQGGASRVDWQLSGELLGLLIDGPILARRLEGASGWNTASGGAHLLAETGELTLWDRVVARSETASIHTDFLRVDAEENLHAETDLVVLSPEGMSFARALESLRREDALWFTDVIGYPSAPEVARLEAPRMRAAADRSASIPTPFTLTGILETGEAWEFEGQQLESHQDSTGRQVAVARGEVSGMVGDANWSGDSLRLREGRLALRGTPCVVRMPLEGGGVAIGRAEHVTLAESTLRLQGKPEVEVPAAALGLGGDMVTVRAQQIERQADGTWVFEHEIEFGGSCSGTARRVTWSADGHLQIERASDDAPLIALWEDGSRVRVHARTIEGRPEGPWELKSELDLWWTAAATDETSDSPAEPPVHITGSRAELSEQAGVVEGPVRLEQGTRFATARRMTWQGNPREGAAVLNLLGDASFGGEEGAGRAARMIYDQATDALELFRGRRPAWLQVPAGREVEADWMRYLVSERLLSSERGRVVPSRPEADPR